MYLTIFDEVEPSGQESVAIDVASLYSEFEKVKDGRGEKGKRWSEPKRPDRTSSQKCGKLVKEETKGEKR